MKLSVAEGRRSEEAATSAENTEEVCSRLGLFDDATTLNLFPFLTWKSNSRDYSLILVGCEKVRVVSTSKDGARAAALLRRGYTLAQVGGVLSLENNGQKVRLRTLLAALYEGQFIRAVNGIKIGFARTSRTREWRHRLEWIAVRARTAAVRRTIKLLPLGLAYAVLDALEPRWPSTKQSAVAKRARINIVSALGGALSPVEVTRITREFVKEQIRRDLDLELLTALSEYEIALWLRKSCVFHGLQNLDSALNAGNGVLLSSFHFSSAHLLVVLLWLRGYSFTGAGGITLPNRDRGLPWEKPELAERLGGCGKVTWGTTFSLKNALGICRALNRGGMGLVYPDSFFTRPGKAVAEYFGHDAAQYAKAQTAVKFLGTTVLANTGVSWIYQQSKAPLVPIKLIRSSREKFDVVIGKPMSIDRSADLPEITGRIYGQLEREICLTPGAWAYWRVFDKFSAAEA